MYVKKQSKTNTWFTNGGLYVHIVPPKESQILEIKLTERISDLR
jgi:hypothetical protein